jgi:DNA-binding NtrC family response regulator
MSSRILVIDGAYGRVLNGSDTGDESNSDKRQNLRRKQFCRRLQLRDVTGDVKAGTLRDPVAEAIFESGQREISGRIENDLDGTLARIEEEVTDGTGFSLLLLSLHFSTGKTGADGRLLQDREEDTRRPFGLELLDRLEDDPVLSRIPVVIMVPGTREESDDIVGEKRLRECSTVRGVVGKNDLDKQELAHLINRDDSDRGDSRFKVVENSKTERNSKPPIPRLLIIDDQYGAALSQQTKRNTLREDFCMSLGLKDITGDVETEKISSPVAEAVFESGQHLKEGRIENDLPGTMQRIREEWGSPPRWSLILLDLQFNTGPVAVDHLEHIREDDLPDGTQLDRDPSHYFGLDILERLWEDPSLRDIPVVILTSNNETREQIRTRFAQHGGVYTFIDKSQFIDKSGDGDRVENLSERYGLIPDPGPPPSSDFDRSRIVGQSVPLLKALRNARRRARQGNVNALVLGETGTGKELLAKYMHEYSGRDGRFVTVNIQGVPDTIVEGRLFGSVPGAFNGAKDRAGAAELADGGTLFIDEFGDIPLSIQEKLKRLLEEDIRETQRLGSNEIKEVDLLVICATDRLDIQSSDDFPDAVLARLHAENSIILPQLRERQEDILDLSKHFISKYTADGVECPELAESAKHSLLQHDWPMNVRGLRKTIRTAVDRRDISVIIDRDLPLDKRPESTRKSISGEEPDGGRHATSSRSPSSLETIIEQLESFDPAQMQKKELRGQLKRLHREYHGLLIRLLWRALDITRSIKSGNIKYTRAADLLVDGDHQSDRAKQFLGRMLKLDERLDSELKFLADILEDLPGLKEWLEEKAPKKLRRVLEDRVEPTEES